MKIPPETHYIRLVRGDIEPLSDLLGRARSRPGSWVNVQPELDPDRPQPSESPLIALFSGRGPANPLGTVVITEGAPIEIGIQHRLGPRFAHQLADAGLAIPETWLVTQDHPRRGLVIDAPVGAPNQVMARWMLATLEHAERAPTTDGVIVEFVEAPSAG